MANRLPLVVILGATGTGKTKLSLELARKFNGEVLGADSMQVYRGLDIVTAKASQEELALVPHHLIDILEPYETFTVLEYRNRALCIINELQNKHKLPIIVGGTNYYIESLLWKILIGEPGKNMIPEPKILGGNEFELPSEELHKKLMQLDPKMARKLHPNNKRKILRSLEVLFQNGRKHSEILEEQHKSIGGSLSGGGLRYPDAFILWVQCDQTVLDQRLNERVDSMIKQGLIEELQNFHQKYVENTKRAPDYTKGVFQSIGFKEFHSYLNLTDAEKSTVKGTHLLNQGIEMLKTATRRYARKQSRWINNRFLGRSDREVPPVYGLDGSDLTKWDESVSARAVKIVDSFVTNSECSYSRLPSNLATSTANAEDDTYVCDVCERVFVGNHQWTIHLKSNKHKRVAARKNIKSVGG